jgi:hypothetical protein
LANDPCLPQHPLGVLVRLAAGRQEPAVKAEKFGTPRIVILLKPVREDEPAGLGQGVFDDGLKK